jgi:uncharacterized repeat protein (TIGR01451 family)
MKKTNNLTLFLLLAFLCASSVSWGQTDLVRWDLTTNGNVSYSDASVNATSIHNGGIATSYNSQGMNTTQWNNSGVVHYRYFGISVASSNGSPIDISNLMFEQETFGPTNYTIRYYISPDGSLPTDDGYGFLNSPGSTVLINSESIASNPVKSIPLNMTISGTQRLIIRFYGTGNDYGAIWRIKANTLKITVPAMEPIATNDNATTAQNFPVDIDILDNDTYSTLSAITITQQPANGQNITVNGLTNVTYTPNTNYTGTDSFKYTITDEYGTSNEATVNVTISAPTPPTAVADAVSTSQNQPVNIDVLANDTQGSGAFNYVTLVSNPSNGTAQVNPNNTVTYTPSNDYLGGDSFQYHVTNTHNMTSNTVTVTIDVTYSPEPLVRWDGTGNGYNPALLASNIIASNITIQVGGTLTNQGQHNQYFLTNASWPNPSQNDGYLNESRYVQFTLSPVENYKINLDEFNFEVQMDGGSANFEVRYSKNFSQGYSSFNGTVGDQSSWGAKSGSLTSVSPVLPGETLYIRLYVYNTYNSLRIRHSWGGSTGPTITGSVSQVSMADLEVNKTVNNPTANVNSNVTFTIQAKNNGPDNATGVVVTDILPSGYQYVSSSSGSYNPGTGQWSIGNLSNSATTTLEITAKVLATGNYTNTASIYSNQGDSNTANNSDSASITPVFPDLEVAKIVDNALPNAGSNVVFTITAENLGPADATGVIVTDVLPDGYAYVSSNTLQGSYNSTTGKWTIGNLNNAGSVSLDITAKVLATGAYNNTATIEGQETDPVSENNTATVNVTPYVPSADLSITKAIDNPNPPVGGNVTYTITVENLGANATTGVTVTDNLPSGFTYISSTNSLGTGTYNPTTGKWVVGNLAVSATATLTIIAQRKATGVYNNIASVTHDGADPVSGNNTANANLQLGCWTCTHTVSGGTITVNAGETYCLHSGTYTGAVILNEGGTICVAWGANFNPTGGSNVYKGTIINRGSMNFPMYNNDTHTATIENYGLFNSTNLQQFSGTLNNFGTVHMTSGVATFLSGAKINNYVDMTLNNVQTNNTDFVNYGNFVVNNIFYLLNGGSFDNKVGATASINMSSGNTEIRGQFDNSGFVEIRNANSGQGISTVVNNYGVMKIYDAVILGTSTYLTNDDLLEFIDIPSVEFQGPLLQNNNTLNITAGNLSLNSPITQMVNNGIVTVSGSVSHNIAGSRVVNSCTIEAGSYFVGNGTSENYGLIKVEGQFKVEGLLSVIINYDTGFIQGTDFRNSGAISGWGSFYFTGDTNFQSAGTMEGNDANNPILFYDVSQTGNQIFDTYVPSNPPINVERPASMPIFNKDTYNCIAPPIVAGYPPNASTFNLSLCEPADVLINLAELVQPHNNVDGMSFTLLYSSIRLFDYNNASNPTNNTILLDIPGKGTFSANTATGLITFTPAPSFVSGVVEAEYRISNEWTGIPPIHPSGRKKITIDFNCPKKIITNPHIRQRTK